MTAGILKYRWAVWVGVALTAGAGGAAIFHLVVDTNVLSMLSPQDPVVSTYKQAEGVLPITNTFLVVVPSEQAEALGEAAADLKRLKEVAAAAVLPSKAGQCLLIGQFSQRTFDLHVVRPAVRKVRAVLDARGLSYGLTGNRVVLLEGTDWLDEDLLRAGLVAVGLLAVFFLVFYRDGLLALLAILPVAVGLAWALGAWSLAGQPLTLLSATVPTLVLGLGVDYTIHLVSAVREALPDAPSRREAVLRGCRQVMRPMMIGALTTAAAFAALLVAEMPGLVHMGWVGVLATLGIFVAAILTVPGILLSLPARWLRPRRSLVNRLMPRVAGFVRRRRVAIVVVASALVAAAAAALPRLRLETDYTRFEDLDRPARRLQDRLMRDWGMSPGLIVLLFESPRQAEAFTADYWSRADAYPTICWVGPQMTTLPGQPSILPLPDGRAATFVHPAEDVYSIHAYERMRADLDRLIESSGRRPTGITGAPVLNKRFSELARRDIRTVLAVCAPVLLACLLVGTRSIRLAVLALTPLVCGVLWASGVLVASGQNLALTGAMVMPLILGIGVDDGIHILLRWRQAGGHLQTVLQGTGRAVFATTATTVCAFSAFVVTRTPALVQVGWLISVGLLGCLVASVVVLPALGDLTGGALFHRARKGEGGNSQ